MAELGALAFDDRQRSEQNFTSFQSRAHFLRHAKGRPQAMQTLLGKVALVKRVGAFLLTGTHLRLVALSIPMRPARGESVLGSTMATVRSTDYSRNARREA